MGKPKRVGTGKPGPGRPKGSVNKITRAAKEAFSQAFDDMGNVAGLVAWGRAHPTEFYKLYSKLIPMDITTNEESITLQFVKGAKPDP